MKTLKRTLCLVLALVMIVGTLAIGASAAEITDLDDIQYQVPVGVMVGMGIIDGYDDGTFQPTKTVNRAEAAKMICYALIGAEAADGLKCSEAPFPDVNATDWYAPYVSYLKQKNVIGGYDDGLFHGNYDVTGLQLAKMLLVAAGYGQNGEYDGSGYGSNTYVDALSKGTKSIFTGSKAADLNAGATREESALYIFNAMCYIAQVTYSAGSEVLGIAPSYTLSRGSMAQERYGYAPDDGFWWDGKDIEDASHVDEGIVVSNSVINSDLALDVKKDEPERTIIQRYYEKDDNNKPIRKDYPFQSDLDLIGHNVKVHWGYDEDNDVVVYLVEDLATVAVDVTAKGTVSDTFKSAELKKLGFSNSNALSDADLTKDAFGGVWEVKNNEIYLKSVTPVDLANNVKANESIYIIANNEDDGTSTKANTIVKYQVQLLDRVQEYKAPTDTKEGEIKLVSGAEYDIEVIGEKAKVKYYEGIAKDDYVYVTKVGDTVAVIEEAVVIEGAISSISTGTKTVTIDGSSYGYTATNEFNANTYNNKLLTAKELKLDQVDTINFGTDNSYVLYANGKIAGSYDADAAGNYAVLLSSDKSKYEAAGINNDFTKKDATISLYLALENGEKVTYNVKLSDTEKKYTEGQLTQYIEDEGLDAYGSVIEYTLSGNEISNVEFVLTKYAKDAVDVVNANTGTIEKGKPTPQNDTNDYYTASTKFVYWRSNPLDDKYGVTAFEGYQNAKTAKGTTVTYVTGDNGKEIVFAYVSIGGGAVSDDYIYIKDLAKDLYSKSENEDGDTIYTYSGYVDGVATQIQAKGSDDRMPTITENHGIYKYVLVDGYLDEDLKELEVFDLANDSKVDSKGKVIYETDGQIDNADGTTLMYDGNPYDCSDAKVIEVNKDGVASEGVLANTKTADSNVYLVLADDYPSNGDLAELSYIYIVEK